MVFKVVVTCPEPEYGYLLVARQQIAWVCTIEMRILMLPFCLLLGLDDGFCFGVAGGPICLILCCTFLCQVVKYIVAQHTAVEGKPALLCSLFSSMKS